jgi:hypothetical protein
MLLESGWRSPVPTPAKAFRPLAAADTDAVRIQVDADPNGGWQVTATSGTRVVASRHYDDWHRVERARLSFAMAPTHPDVLPAR